MTNVHFNNIKKHLCAQLYTYSWIHIAAGSHQGDGGWGGAEYPLVVPSVGLMPVSV